MKILCPIPTSDFDPTELSVPWKELKAAGHKVVFATPDGKPGAADIRMCTGTGLGLLKSVLMAESFALEAYSECIKSEEFLNPINYESINCDEYDALFLPGGHAKGMREYLESLTLHRVTSDFFSKDKPVAAICHGTLLVARSKDPATGKSVIYNRKTTGLNFTQELIAWLLTFLWLGDYYRTYKTFMETEVRSLQHEKSNFVRGPLPLLRDRPGKTDFGFALRDGNYLSARWPGDINKFSEEFVKMLS